MTHTADLYTQRINLVLNYVDAHLTDDLSLETLADVAGFSPFHFHRIFKNITNENLNAYIVRRRLDRAAALLRALGESPRRSPLTHIALDCGFNSLSDFSRTFRKWYGITPSKWDRQTTLQPRKIRQTLDLFSAYPLEVLRQAEHDGEFQVKIREYPEQPIAYVRAFEAYQPEILMQAHDRLLTWYRAQGGDPLQAVMIGMSQDDPDVTPMNLCRYDLCLTLPAGWRSDGDVSVRVLPTFTAVCVRVEGDIFKVDKGWQFLFRYWLPRSRYLPDNLPAMEWFCRQPSEIGWERFDLEAIVAVIPA